MRALRTCPISLKKARRWQWSKLSANPRKARLTDGACEAEEAKEEGSERLARCRQIRLKAIGRKSEAFPFFPSKLGSASVCDFSHSRLSSCQANIVL